jgi:hypothetical protein
MSGLYIAYIFSKYLEDGAKIGFEAQIAPFVLTSQKWFLYEVDVNRHEYRYW